MESALSDDNRAAAASRRRTSFKSVVSAHSIVSAISRARHAEILAQRVPGQHIVEIGRQRLSLTLSFGFRFRVKRRHRLAMMFDQTLPKAGAHGAADPGQRDGAREMRMRSKLLHSLRKMPGNSSGDVNGT